MSRSHNVKSAIFRCSKCLYVRVELLPEQAVSIATIAQCPTILDITEDPCEASLRFVPPEYHTEFLRNLFSGLSDDSHPESILKEASEDASAATLDHPP